MDQCQFALGDTSGLVTALQRHVDSQGFDMKSTANTTKFRNQLGKWICGTARAGGLGLSEAELAKIFGDGGVKPATAQASIPNQRQVKSHGGAEVIRTIATSRTVPKV